MNKQSVISLVHFLHYSFLSRGSKCDTFLVSSRIVQICITRIIVEWMYLLVIDPFYTIFAETQRFFIDRNSFLRYFNSSNESIC